MHRKEKREMVCQIEDSDVKNTYLPPTELTVVSYWAVPYLLGILSSTPESQTAPVEGTPYPTPTLHPLVGERGFFAAGIFCRRVMRVTVRLLFLSNVINELGKSLQFSTFFFFSFLGGLR